MTDPGATQQLNGNAAVMFTLGQLDGKLSAILEGQRAQGELNAENRKEHEEFRKTLGVHGEILAVLKDNKAEASETKRERVQRWMVYLGIPATILASAGIIAWLISSH